MKHTSEQLLTREQYETNIAELAKYVKENNPGCLEYRWKKLPLEGDTQTYVWFEK
jgi:hypothetical protein